MARGEVLYRPGDEGGEVFLVREGYVRLVLPGMEREMADRTVAIALPWELFGEEALSAGPRRYGAVAGRRGVVQPLPSDRVVAALKGARLSLGAYLAGVEREVHRLRHHQGGSHRPSAAQRLAETLLDLGERCGERVGRGVRLGERLTHQVLADLAGAHRATVTTRLNDWIYDGVLATDERGRLVIARPAELWRSAGYDGPPDAAEGGGGEGDAGRR